MATGSRVIEENRRTLGQRLLTRSFANALFVILNNYQWNDSTIVTRRVPVAELYLAVAHPKTLQIELSIRWGSFVSNRTQLPI